jgi:hypothetical protein
MRLVFRRANTAWIERRDAAELQRMLIRMLASLDVGSARR